MATFWLTFIMATLLSLYYWANTLNWNFNRMYTDNKILKNLKKNNNADLVEILKECGADTFEIKNVDKLSRKKRKHYFKSIEFLFNNIKSHFKSECAQMLIDRRHDDIDYVMDVEKHCNTQESCKTCKLKRMRIQLKYWAVFFSIKNGSNEPKFLSLVQKFSTHTKAGYSTDTTFVNVDKIIKNSLNNIKKSLILNY